MSHAHHSSRSGSGHAGHGHGGHGGHAGHGEGPGAEPFTKSLERMNRFQEPEARALIADLRLPVGSIGIDVGCGVGLYTLWLAQAVGPGGRVVGIEPTAERAAAASELVAGEIAAGRLEFREGDGTALAMDARSVDWVWCGDVLHHIVKTEAALAEFRRIVRPGGRIVIKESQVLSAMFLPGHPELERRIQLAEIERTREEGGGRSFLERRQSTLASLSAAGLDAIDVRTYLLTRRAPLGAADHTYIQQTVFDRNWGDRLREFLSPEDWTRRTELCNPAAPANVLRPPDSYCLYPITVFTARAPS